MSRLIVSLTSYPKRINCVKTVLESIYAQTLKADEILLWLAEEEFPNREVDLPLPLREDLIANKFSLRWCDNLGSHKKYFYSMQEYPEDIIVTVDDTYYHPDTLQSLMDMHVKYPDAVVARTASLIEVDSDFNPLPSMDWLFDFQFLKEPSMLLVAIGVGGVLYPPHSVNERIFDKAFILESSTVKGNVCGDDYLLKAGEMLNKTPVVSVPSEPYYTLPGTQESALFRLMPDNHHKDQLLERYREKYKEAFDEESLKRLKKAVSDFEEMDKRFSLRKITWLREPSRDLEKVIGYLYLPDAPAKPDTADYKYIKESARFAARVFTAFTDGDSDEEVARAIYEFRKQLLDIPDIEKDANADPVIRGFIDYGVALNVECHIIYHGIQIHMRSLKNWLTFMKAHPDCDPIFRKGFKTFMKSLEKELQKTQTGTL